MFSTLYDRKVKHDQLFDIVEARRLVYVVLTRLNSLVDTKKVFAQNLSFTYWGSLKWVSLYWCIFQKGVILVRVDPFESLERTQPNMLFSTSIDNVP